MELDMKIQNSSLALFNKSSNTQVGLDFLSLIQDKKADFGGAVPAKTAADNSERAVPAKPKADPKAIQEDPKRDIKKKAKEAVSETASQEAKLSDKPSENKAVKTDTSAEKPVSKKNDGSKTKAADNTANPTVTEEVVSVEDVVESVAAVVAAAFTAIPENVPAVDAGLLDPATQVDMPLQPADLSSLGMVMYFDAASQTVQIIDGADLAAKLQSGEIPQVLPSQVIPLQEDQVSPLMVGKELELPADFAMEEVIEDPQSLLSKLMPKQDSKAPETTVEVGEIADAELVDQTAELSKIVGKDHKVKFTVSTEEEKFSYRSQSDLVADVAEVENAVETKTSVSQQEILKPAKQSSEQTLASAVDTAPTAAPNATASAAVIPVAVSAATSSPAASSAVVENSATVLSASPVNQEAANVGKLAGTDFKARVEDAYKGMSKEVVDQVKVNITKSAVRGTDKIEISLKPEDLGKIEIKMHIAKDGKLQAQIVASRPETLEILQKDAQTLQKAFEDAGLQADENSLTFTYQNENAFQNQEDGSDLRKFKGDLFADNANNDNSADLYDEQYWDGKSGLNIKV